MAKPSVHFASLPLQVVLYFGGWYLALFYVAEIALVTYKAIDLPYPSRNLVAEVLLLIFLAFLDFVRIFQGIKGNLTGRRLALIISLVFSVPLFIGYLYLTLWQTYVLRIDLVLVSFSFLGLLLAVVLGVIKLWILQLTARPN